MFWFGKSDLNLDFNSAVPLLMIFSRQFTALYAVSLRMCCLVLLEDQIPHVSASNV